MGNRTIQITTNIAATCLAKEVLGESGMTYGAPWKSPNLSTPQVFSARNSSTELTKLLFPLLPSTYLKIKLGWVKRRLLLLGRSLAWLITIILSLCLNCCVIDLEKIKLYLPANSVQRCDFFLFKTVDPNCLKKIVMHLEDQVLWRHFIQGSRIRNTIAMTRIWGKTNFRISSFKKNKKSTSIYI